MSPKYLLSIVLGSSAIAAIPAFAGQVPGNALAPDIPISHSDRVYAAEQFSNTVSVTNPVDNTLLRPAAGQFLATLQGPSARARYGLFARP